MTSLLEDIFEDILSVRRKKNSTRKLLSRASRVARGVPEVMVKITGFGKSTAHIQSHFDYISRKGDILLETDSGEHLGDREDIKQYFEAWQEKGKTEKQRPNRRETLHLVLSMPAHVDSESVRQASSFFARDVFNKHEYAFALHTDSSNPHCHLVIRMTDRDGRRINPRKADLQHWREVFVEKIREQGYEAEATSRRTRGIMRKRVKSAVWHIELSKTNKPHTPKVQVFNEITGDAPASSHPGKNAIHKKPAQVLQSWLQAEEKLGRQPDPQNVSFARHIHETAATMPPAETERDRTRRELLERFKKPTEKTAAPAPVMSEKEPVSNVSQKRKQELER